MAINKLQTMRKIASKINRFYHAKEYIESNGTNLMSSDDMLSIDKRYHQSGTHRFNQTNPNVWLPHTLSSHIHKLALNVELTFRT